LFVGGSAWITEDLIWPYADYRDKYKSLQRPSRVFQEAIDTAEDLFASLAAKKVCTAMISYVKKNKNSVNLLAETCYKCYFFKLCILF